MKQRLLIAAIAAGVSAAIVYVLQKRKRKQPEPFHGKRKQKRMKGFTKELYANGATR
jgi:hypothetical protein